MAFEYQFPCKLPNGLHARPASHLEACASRFPADVTLVNQRTGVEANAKSVLAMISADIHSGDPLLLRVSGTNAETAFADLTHFIDHDFASSDEALPVVASNGGGQRLPRSLKAAAPEKYLTGTIQCAGIARGVIVQTRGLQLSDSLREIPEDQKGSSFLQRQTRFHADLSRVLQTLEKEAASSNGLQRDVLRSHISLIKDISLIECVERNLADDSKTIAAAIIGAVAQFTATLRNSTSSYLQERVLDLQDIGARLLTEIYGLGALAPGIVLNSASIVVAESLTPGQFLALDRTHLRGLVLQHAGATSHTVILARSFGLPTLVGAEKATALPDGIEAILDTYLGLLLPEPNEATLRYYMLEEKRMERVSARTHAFLKTPGTSRDGKRVPILANVSSADEVTRAMSQGAEGVGLFRTEMLFMDRDTPPSEDQQAAIYTEAVRAARGFPVTLRTFDIGGDKPVSYLNLPKEANPFLGYRGARIYEEFTDLLNAQLRAMLRAASHGPVRIMAPMIAHPEEMEYFRSIVDRLRTTISAPDVMVGMMIEVPSTAFAINDFAKYADFFSLGTNDLLQYFLAVDRDNAQVAHLSSAFHPTFIRFLRHIVEQAHKEGRPVGLCGELAEKSLALPLLVGLGLDSLSLGSARLLATKAALSQLDASVCRTGLEDLVNCTTRTAVELRLKAQSSVVPQPMLTVDTIVVDSDGRTKHEVIKELTDLLSASERLNDSHAIEETIWLREEVYSTGFGSGFAVPHCQSDHVKVSSIAVVRLKEPVEWGSLDGLPVRIAILLALRAEDKGREHLRIFAKLSRLVMREDFRQQLEQAPDAKALLAILAKELD